MEMPIAARVRAAGVALGISALLLHGQIADALVVRGDEQLYRARPARALTYYRRAVWFDRANGTAVDRFSFVAMTLRDVPAMREGIALASRYLAHRADDAVVRMDRAMAYRVLGDGRRALADFSIVARQTNDARAYAFAGEEAASLGERGAAEAFWRAALALWPGMPLAVHGRLRERWAR